ncbi:MAG: hypothetical protein U0Y96_13505 [Candidatus Kapaibacterium sp.]
MKPLLILIFAFFSVYSYSQEYEWGYRFTVGDTFRYRTKKIVTQVKDERSHDDTLIIKVINVDAEGNITLLFAEQKQKDTTDWQVVGGTEAQPGRYSFKYGTLLSGSEATITMTRYGKFLRGEFTTLDIEHRKARESQLKDTSESYRQSFIKNEQGSLRYVLNYYFPRLSEQSSILLHQTWNDSTVSNNNSLTLKDGKKILNKQTTKKRLDFVLYDVTNVQGIPCFRIGVKEDWKQSGKIGFEMKSDEVFYLRVSDCALVTATLNSVQQLDGEWFCNTEITHKLLP